MFITNNHASLHLWWKKNLLNHEEVSKSWEHDSTEFQFKLAILIFWTKSASKQYFLFKKEKINDILEFCIFELFLAPNCSLKCKFYLFWIKFAQKVIPHQTQKKWTSLLNSAFRISLDTKFQHDNCDFLEQTCFHERCFWLKTEKVDIPLNSPYLN